MSEEQVEKSAYPVSFGPFMGLKIQITSEEIRTILSGRIGQVRADIEKAKVDIERIKKITEQLKEAKTDTPNDEDTMETTCLLNSNVSTVENGEEIIKYLSFIRDHTPLNQVFIVDWDEFSSSWLDQRRN